MPHLISNPGSRQSHPLYRNKCTCNHHAMKNIDGAYKTDMEKSPVSTRGFVDQREKTETLPKTYDAIKNAAGAQASMGKEFKKPMRRK